jgi:hypothetical protein
MWGVSCKFEPDYLNPVTGRRGQWRVIACGIHDRAWDLAWGDKQNPIINMRTTKPYPIGCIIRPHKELNRVLDARKSENVSHTI